LNSLREVCLGLAGCESPLKHLGIRTAPKKSTLAYANAHRPWELYQSIFMQLLDKCQTETATRTRRKFRFKNKRMSLDGSIIASYRPACSTAPSIASERARSSCICSWITTAIVLAKWRPLKNENNRGAFVQ
jgi:hypothetical protein